MGAPLWSKSVKKPRVKRLQAASEEKTAADDTSIIAQEQLDQATDQDDSVDVIRTPDGGAILRKRKPANSNFKGKHFDNLAENTDPDFQRKLQHFANDIWDDIQVDVDTAKKGADRYARALGDTGVTGKAPGGASFDGASTVTHSILGEVCFDYSARVIREMLPPSGPARPHVDGILTKESFERAKRVARHMNYQTRRVMRNFAAEMSQTWTQQPLAGAGYIKLWRGQNGKPKIAFVPQDNVHRPASDDDFYSCERITHEMSMSKRRLLKAMKDGLYKEWDPTSAPEIERTKVERQADKATGTEAPTENVDDVRPIYETACWWDGVGDDSCPYILTMDKESKTVLALYRNYKEDDDEVEPIDFLIEFPFWEFRGGKPIGLATMLSGIPKAATGALRALLDSSLRANFSGAVKLKGGQSGSTSMPAPNEITEVENATGTDDIRKLIFPTNIAGPSETLLKLLGILIDTARGMVRASFDDIISKGTADIPVRTMMMLLDEGTIVYSSIFARQHRAMERVLAGQYRINQQMPKSVKFSDRDGEETVSSADYTGDCIVMPVSDPRINSETQRWTRANFVAERADKLSMNPATSAVYKAYQVEKNVLEAGGIEGIDMLLNKPVEATEMSAPNENVALSLGRAVAAYPEQNHLAHIESHIDFGESPLYGQSPVFMPQVIPAGIQHVKEHIALEYAARTMKMIDGAIKEAAPEYFDRARDRETLQGKMDIVEMMRMKEPELGRKIDMAMAVASRPVLESLQADLEKVMPVLAKWMQQAQQFKPPQPMDPTRAAMETTKLATDAQQAIADKRTQVDQAKIVADDKRAADKLAADAGKTAEQIAQDDRDLAGKRDMNREDNTTAITITEMRDGKGNLTTGTGIGV